LPEARPCRWLAAPLPRLVGRLSYSLYLWHWPGFVLFRWTVGLDGIGSCLAALAIAVALASLSYAWVEAPIRSSGRIRGVSRHKVVLTSLVLVAVAGSAGVTMFHLHNRLTLSRTGNAVAWYANDTRPLNPAWTRCEPVQTRRSFLGGLALSWTPRHCRTAPGQLFVVGDSFARAYLPAARQFAADTGMTVRLYSLPACGFVPLNRPMPVSGDCHDFVVAAYRDLKARFRPGDVLFITDRRIDPLVEEGGPPPPASPWPDAERDRALALREGRMWLLPLAAAGLRIVQEAPKPIFRAAPFRCVDWFNRGNSICAGGLTMAAAELQAMRAPVLRSQRRLAATVPGVSLWDPFPILCPGAVCRAIGPDGPRFTDSDHLSGHGNDLLYPGFRAAILAAMPSPAKRLAAATVAGPAS
jgi:hypothetical protein